jgi:PAS domain S-box-containing protein
MSEETVTNVNATPSPAASADASDLCENVRAFMVHLDREFRVVHANGPFRAAVGDAAAPGAVFVDQWVPAADRKRVRRGLANAARRGESVTLEVRLENGDRDAAIRWRAYPHDGEGSGLLLLGEVVQHPTAPALSVSASQQLEVYRVALDASAIVAVTDRRGRITYVNDRFCDISKYERSELLGRDHRILNSGYHSKEFFKNLWRTISRGQIWRGDIRNRASDGSFYWVATTIVPVLDEMGTPQEYIAIRSEVTERKLAEASLERTVRELALAREQDKQHAEELERAMKQLEAANHQIREEHAKLVQAEKLSSIGFLSAGVAHEINNPLAGVMACVKALRGSRLKPERRQAYFDTVEEGLERIQHTVRGMLDYARQKPADPKNYFAGDLIERCWKLVQPMARKKDVRLDIDPEVSLLKLRVDKGQAMQAIMNLLLNAVQASPDGQPIHVASDVDGEFGVLRVRDHGSGMPEEVAARATDPFFSTKPEGEGTGLGLAVTLSVANAHGGSIAFESEPGEGTTAVLALPRVPDDEVPS